MQTTPNQLRERSPQINFDAAKSVICTKCESTQIVANKRGFSFKNMFKTLAILLAISFLLSFINLIFGVIGTILAFLSLPISFVVGLVGRNELVNGCMKCGHRWHPRSKRH